MKTILFTLIFLFTAVNSFSAVRTWDGGGADANWGTAANWVGDVAPVAGDSLVFPATAAQYATVNNLSASFASLTVEGGNYTVGGSSLALTGGLTVNGGSPTFNTLVQISVSQTFRAASGSTITLAVLLIVGGFAGSPVLTLDGAGNFGIGVINSIQSVSLIKNGAGATLIVGAGSFSGSVTLNDGVLAVDANIPNSTITINGGSIGGEFGFSGFGGTGTVGVTTVNAGVISAGTLTSPTGILNTRNLAFGANGNYVAKIGGTAPGAGGHDQLNVTGTVTLNNARFVPLPFGAFRPAIGDSFTVLRNDGADLINGTFLNAPEGAIFAGALNTAFRITYRGGDGNDIVITRVARAAFDFDGDGRSDIAVFRPSNGTWFLNQSTAGFRAAQFGAGEDRLVPADYDGDNRTDIAVFRPANGTWYLLRSSDGTFSGAQFGAVNDVPVPYDYDGDGRADLAVFRPSNGTWYQLRSIAGQAFAQAFGQNGDQPLVGDFDGDGFGDLAVFRAGVWFLYESASAALRAVTFGTVADKKVPADYDGDGKTDIAVFRPSNGTWYVQNSANNAVSGVQFGAAEDVPVAADYDGDGRTDIAVWRPSNGVWYLNRTTGGFTGIQFGQNGDRPVSNAFIP